MPDAKVTYRIREYLDDGATYLRLAEHQTAEAAHTAMHEIPVNRHRTYQVVKITEEQIDVGDD